LKKTGGLLKEGEKRKNISKKSVLELSKKGEGRRERKKAVDICQKGGG